MPAECETTWYTFHGHVSKVKDDPNHTDRYLGQVYERLAEQIPDELKGVPRPPTVEQCGPNRDGTWTQDGASGLRYTKLEAESYKKCLLEFA